MNSLIPLNGAQWGSNEFIGPLNDDNNDNSKRWTNNSLNMIMMVLQSNGGIVFQYI
jgi:hypothetical protein